MINAIHGILGSKVIGYARFDGIDDHITGQGSAINLQSNFTVTCRFRYISMPSPSAGLVTWGEQQTGKRRGLIIWNGGAGSSYYLYSSNYGSNLKGTTILQPNTWYHAAATLDSAGNGNLYLNGVLEISGSQAVTAFNYLLTYMGRTGTGEYFNGDLDEARIYNSVLTGADIIIDRDTPRLSPASNLAGYFPLDGTANDASGNSNVGTAYNGVTFIRQ